MKNFKYLIAVLVLFFVLLGVFAVKMNTVSNGREVILKIAPVDPRDPLRGDYVTFTYDISRLEVVDSVERLDKIYEGKTVYIPLYQYGSVGSAWKNQETVSLSEIESINKNNKDAVYLKGVITSVNKSGNRANIRITYGAEQYFIPEGAGRTFSFWNKEALAKLSVGSDGQGVLRQLYVDGKLWP